MNHVSLNSVIAEAISITPDTDASDWSIARQWGMTALSQLGVAEDEIAVCSITAKNLILKKPKDMRQYIEMALYDVNGCWIPHIFRAGKKRIYPDSRIDTSTDEIPRIVSVDVSEDKNAFYLGTNGTDVSYATVRYYSYPLDDNGFPMIREDEKFAIMCYIRWAKSAKKNENQSEIANNWTQWAWQCDRAMAHKKASGMSNDKAKTIARAWVSLLPNFNYNKF